MAWPPIIPPNTFANLAPQQDAHPDAHNRTADALVELRDALLVPAVIVVRLQTSYAGSNARVPVLPIVSQRGGWTGSGTDELGVPVTGIYMVSFQMNSGDSFQPDATLTIIAAGVGRKFPVAPGTTTTQTATIVEQLSAGQKLSFEVSTGSGGPAVVRPVRVVAAALATRPV